MPLLGIHNSRVVPGCIQAEQMHVFIFVESAHHCKPVKTMLETFL